MGAPEHPTPVRQGHARGTLALLVLLSAAHVALAAKPERELPIEVRARSVEVNEKTGVAVYRGDVVVRQGELELRGERVEVRGRANRPEQIRAFGNPASARQGEDLLTAAEIHYDINAKVLQARAGDAPDAPRVHAVLQPRPATPAP
jgi:lipopolysaccharide export system protein LptA